MSLGAEIVNGGVEVLFLKSARLTLKINFRWLGLCQWFIWVVVTWRWNSIWFGCILVSKINLGFNISSKRFEMTSVWFWCWNYRSSLWWNFFSDSSHWRSFSVAQILVGILCSIASRSWIRVWLELVFRSKINFVGNFCSERFKSIIAIWTLISWSSVWISGLNYLGSWWFWFNVISGTLDIVSSNWRIRISFENIFGSKINSWTYLWGKWSLGIIRTWNFLFRSSICICWFCNSCCRWFCSHIIYRCFYIILSRSGISISLEFILPPKVNFGFDSCRNIFMSWIIFRNAFFFSHQRLWNDSFTDIWWWRSWSNVIFTSARFICAWWRVTIWYKLILWSKINILSNISKLGQVSIILTWRRIIIDLFFLFFSCYVRLIWFGFC